MVRPLTGVVVSWWHSFVFFADRLTKRRHVDLVRVGAQACRDF
ncbi:hypothetical protein AB0I53_18260 [Saccharopolyspora sp. NPDC050389]